MPLDYIEIGVYQDNRTKSLDKGIEETINIISKQNIRNNLILNRGRSCLDTIKNITISKYDLIIMGSQLFSSDYNLPPELKNIIEKYKGIEAEIEFSLQILTTLREIERHEKTPIFVFSRFPGNNYGNIKERFLNSGASEFLYLKNPFDKDIEKALKTHNLI